ncbi:MAG: hypothetical protein ACYDBJ_11775 [Aggregatilineales bacterium]
MAKRAEERLPHLLADITAMVDGQSQTDARFESSRLYTRLLRNRRTGQSVQAR